MKIKKNHLNNNGQLSIFLGIFILIIVSLMAFIINVGLFVKAKVNLQNAVDAAAWSGAATQSRQLSNIAYLNWELRNNYKEWMFKYYVIGQLSLSKTAVTNLDNVGNYLQYPDTMSFRMNPFWEIGNPKHNESVFDMYNIPSTCIHFGTGNNICEIYKIPGLPRFKTTGLPGISEQHEAFLNSIVSSKSKDCAQRTTLNFSTAMIWAYGTKKVIFQNSPKIAAHRVGAWPNAVQLAMRMRNLEMIVNRPPAKLPICLNPGSAGGSCMPVESLESEATGTPLNERPIKAFWSGLRNLSSEMKATFKLTELKPNPFSSGTTSLSSFLIPPSSSIGQTGVSATTKHYLDLQAYPLNLATFFTTFVTATTAATSSSVEAQAACTSSKTAIPVPAFIMGFVKNPNVLTYYSVKGEAKFVGLFFPFTETTGINLKAYSTAKPYGGRIGPRLFGISSDNQSIRPRNENSQSRSLPYIGGLQVPAGGGFQPGYPVPVATSFWVSTDGDDIGGIPGSTASTRFAIPNLLYDYERESSELNDHVASSDKIMIFSRANTDSQTLAPRADESRGLYDKSQFRQFAKNLPAGLTSTATIDQALEQVRKPTKYEALNYLLPTSNNSKENIETVSHVQSLGSTTTGAMQYKIYAPLIGQFLLYKNEDDVITQIQSFIAQNETAIKSFDNAMKNVSDNIRNSAAANTQGSTQSYTEAASAIWMPSPDCTSLSGRFRSFFNGGGSACRITTLSESIREYISSEASLSNTFNNYFVGTFVPPAPPENRYMTAYMPGPNQGAAISGELVHPFLSGKALLAKRNFYSTKFISTNKIISGGQFPFNEKGIYLEQPAIGSTPSDIPDSTPVRNSLPRSQLSEFKTIDY